MEPSKDVCRLAVTGPPPFKFPVMEVKEEKSSSDVPTCDVGEDNSLIPCTEPESRISTDKSTGGIPPIPKLPMSAKLAGPILEKVKLFAQKHPDVVAKDNASRSLGVMSKETDDEEYDANDVYDISTLFSDKFDKAYKRHTKGLSKKQKKRKRNAFENRDVGDAELPPKKSRPNYFIAVQVHNEQIRKRIKDVQTAILKREPDLKGAMIPLPAIHLTLMVMYLSGDDDIKKVSEALEDALSKLHHFSENPIVMKIKEIGDFNKKVVFAKVDKEKIPDLEKVVDVVEHSVKEAGIESTDEKGFKPHITIMKLSKHPKLRNKRGYKIDTDLYRGFNDRTFGLQTVCSLQLCSMMKPKDKSGYYHVEHKVNFVPGGYTDELMDFEPSTNHREELVRILEWDFKKPEDT